MDDGIQPPVTAARELVRRLQAMQHAPAPASLLPNVLTQLGLADAYALVDTAVGPVFVAYNNLGVSALMQAEDAAAFERLFRARFGRVVKAAPSLPGELAHDLHRQIGGEAGSLRFDLRNLSEFDREVLLKALEIPRGEVRPYAWIAREIGRPKAVRAVGTALAGNPVPLLIPCHRVVRSDGRIGNYIFGSDKKRAVLEAEGAAPEVIERLARSGVRFLGGPSGAYCYPTCGGDHLLGRPDQVPFHSEREALAAGFRPCTDCRPAGRV